MKKYMLIEVFGREITTSRFYTLEEAYNTMKYNLSEVCNSINENGNIDEEKLIGFENNGDIGIEETMAWSSYKDTYDAKIIVFE